MAKIKLGSRPKNFPKTVTVPMLEGGEGYVPMSFIYRTRSEFGAFVDELTASAGVTPASGDEKDIKFSLKTLMDKSSETSAANIMQIADGWGLDEEFTLANVKQLCDELPGVAHAILETYRIAITEGRLGN